MVFLVVFDLHFFVSMQIWEDSYALFGWTLVFRHFSERLEVVFMIFKVIACKSLKRKRDDGNNETAFCKKSFRLRTYMDMFGWDVMKLFKWDYFGFGKVKRGVFALQVG